MTEGVDRALKLALRMPGPQRVGLARRAARRGLSADALRAAPNDPDVLIELGMYVAAAAHERTDVPAVTALAGLGRIAEARRCLENTPGVDARARSRLARIVAVSDPEWALSLLSPDRRADRAACLVALDRPDAAEALLGDMPPTMQVRLLLAAISAARQDWRRARIGLNAMYQAEGLPPVVDETDAPLSLDAFRSRTAAVRTEGPLVSVVIAARNAAETIGTALASLKSQTWRPLEILVVDDGSSDATVSRVKAMAATDDRIRLLANTRTPGAYGARNTGVAAAQGSIIAFHDADDWAHPNRMERQVDMLSGRRAASVCGHFRLDSAGRIMSPRIYPMARLNPILTMVRRDLIASLGAFEEVRLGADSEFLARLQTGLGRTAVARNHAPLVVAGWSRSSLMSSPETGMSLEGLALRVAYVETWRRRHADRRLKPATAEV